MTAWSRLRRWWSGAAAEQLRALQEEIEADRREISETRPIVEEAVRRTNETFIAVEAKTLRTLIECELARDLSEGWNGRG